MRIPNYPLPNDSNTEWVIINGDDKYLVGDFDGREFKPLTGKKRCELGENYHAAQSWHNMPQSDPRRIQIAWVCGGIHPKMPFNQQLSLPCELTPHTSADGPALHRYPIREIAILFYPNRSKYAELACPNGAVVTSGSVLDVNRRRCTACEQRACVTQWHHPAFDHAGGEISLGEIVARAKQHRPFWTHDGGVTFGGGEPTLQAEDVAVAVKALRGENIHVAIETNASTRSLARFVGQVDLIICDLKCVSRELHLRWVGCENQQVLENLMLAAREQPDLWIRVPLVPGMSDDNDEMDRMVAFLAGLPKRRTPLRVEVLRMHHAGAPKYAALGMAYPMAGIAPPSVADAQRFVDKATGAGLAAMTGG